MQRPLSQSEVHPPPAARKTAAGHRSQVSVSIEGLTDVDESDRTAAGHPANEPRDRRSDPAAARAAAPCRRPRRCRSDVSALGARRAARGRGRDARGRGRSPAPRGLVGRCGERGRGGVRPLRRRSRALRGMVGLRHVLRPLRRGSTRMGASRAPDAGQGRSLGRHRRQPASRRALGGLAYVRPSARPRPGVPEAVGTADVLAVALELVTAASCAWALTPTAWHADPPPSSRSASSRSSRSRPVWRSSRSPDEPIRCAGRMRLAGAFRHPHKGELSPCVPPARC